MLRQPETQISVVLVNHLLIERGRSCGQLIVGATVLALHLDSLCHEVVLLLPACARSGVIHFR